jgi:hypothetical protein
MMERQQIIYSEIKLKLGRGKFTLLNVYIRKEEISKTKDFKKLEKEQIILKVRNIKGIIKTRMEINKTENRQERKLTKLEVDSLKRPTKLTTVR